MSQSREGGAVKSGRSAVNRPTRRSALSPGSSLDIAHGQVGRGLKKFTEPQGRSPAASSALGAVLSAGALTKNKKRAKADVPRMQRVNLFQFLFQFLFQHLFRREMHSPY